MAMTDDSSSLRVVQPNNSTSRSTSPRQPSTLPQSRPQPPTEQQQQAGERPPASPTSYAFSAPYPMAPAPTSPRQRPSNGIHDPSSFFQLPRYSFPPNLVPVQPSAPGIRRHPSYKTPANSPSSGTSPPRIPYPSSNGSISHVTETHHITKDYDHRTGAKTINRYEFHETIGRGVHGKVKLARDTETGEPMAIKIVNRISKKRLGRMDPLEAESKVRREIAIMKKCVHPNVVALREVMDDPNSKKIYLVLEYMAGGQLQWRDAENNPVLNIEQIRSIVRDIVLGLEYLHFQGIIHRDIKPANLLLSNDHHVKISDFGVSHLSKVDEETGQLLTENELELSKTAGSPAFFAPEICQTTASPEEKRPPITKAIDVWALGITLHCLLFGRTPFPETGGEFQLFNMICTAVIPIPPPEFEEEDVDEEVLDLLKRLLIKNAEDRITLEEVKRHPFILRTIPDPEKWIEETDPRHIGAKLEVTAEEVSAAVSITERVKRTLYKIQSSLSGLTGLRRRATTGKSVTSSKRSTSVSTIEPSSPDGRSVDSPRHGSQISVDSMDQRISSGTSSSKPSPPQALSRKPSTTKPPPLPSQSENPAPLRPSRSVRSSARRPCDVRDTSAPSMPRSRAISDLSRGLNGETTNYLTDDYSNGLYFSDDLISHGSSYVDESEEEEDEGHLLIDFGRRRRSRQEAENLAKQLEVSKLSGKIDEETASLASSGGSVKPKKGP